MGVLDGGPRAPRGKGCLGDVAPIGGATENAGLENAGLEDVYKKSITSPFFNRK